MLRHCYLLVLLLFLAGLGSARAQTFAWAKVIRGIVDTTFVQPQASATDAAGNTYVAVALYGSLNADGIMLSGSANSAALIKYDSTGSVVWAKALRNIEISRLAPDNSAGGIFVVGFNKTGATWDGTPLPAGSYTSFYAKCLPNGALQWSHPMPDALTYYDKPSVVADNAGNAYFLGVMGATGTVSGTSVGVSQTFVFKTDAAGVTQWVRILHDGGPSPLLYYLGLGPKPSGGVLVTGTAVGVYLGADNTSPLLTGRSQRSGFLTSFDAAGTHQWSQYISTANSASAGYVNAVAADATGNCYATGSSYGAALQIGSTTLPSGFFLAKYGATGGLQWVRGALPTSAATGFQDAGGLMAASSTGVTVGVSTNALKAPPTPVLTLETLPLRSPNHLVHYNAQGQAQWTVADQWPGYIQPIPPYFMPTQLGSDAHGNLFITGIPSYFRQFGQPVARTAIVLGAQTVVGSGAIVTRLNAYANTLRGQVYLDQNGNGQQDATEGIFPRTTTATLVQGPNTTHSAVGTDGVLQAYADPGAYTLGLSQIPIHYKLSEPSSNNGTYVGTFSSNNQLVSGQDFGVAPVANQPDLRVTLTAYGVARPGFTARYRLTVENVGTTVVPAGTATVTLDALASYVGSTPAGSVAGQVITCAYATLAPFARSNTDILFSLPVNAQLGAIMHSTATAALANDVAPADNTAALPQTVVASADPNSIEVNYQRLTPAQVAAQQPLDYTIRFQNLGTAAAVNVLLSDTLDFHKLNLASLQLVAQSHNCTWSLTSTGPNTGLLTVRLLDINLPYRNQDVIGSQGFVRFRVQPRTTLTVGEIIPNHARIVFDYNASVRTNTATTTVLLATAALARHDAPAWAAYPNPATDALTVAADLASGGPVRVELLDVLGRPVRQQTLTAPAGPLRQTLDLRGLAPGLYVLRLTPPTGPASSRPVVRE